MTDSNLVEMGMIQTTIPNLLKSISLLQKEIQKIGEDKNPKAVKGAAKKVQENIEIITKYSDYGQMFVFQKFICDNLEEYIVFLNWIQTLPKIPNSQQISLLFLKVHGLMKVDLPLKESLITQRDTIDWTEKKCDVWGEPEKVKSKNDGIFQNLFEDSDEIKKNIEAFDSGVHYKSFSDIINEKYKIIDGHLISRSRLNPGIKVNIRRDNKL